MRISDWSSDVCSSDLRDGQGLQRKGAPDFRIPDPVSEPLPPRPRGLLGCLPGLRGARHPARGAGRRRRPLRDRSEEHTSELQSLMRISYAVFCLKKKKNTSIQNERPEGDSQTK